jgi:cytochrome c biogenesis protein CcdA
MGGMASFAFGLSIPAIALSAIASEAGKRYDLGGILRSGGYLLVGLGCIIILFEAFAIYRMII